MNGEQEPPASSTARQRLSKLAVVAFLSSLPCIVVLGIVYEVLPLRHAFILPHLWLVDSFSAAFWGAQVSRSAGLREALIVPGLISLTVIPAIVLGFVGVIRIDRSRGRLKGVTLGMTAIGVAMVTSLFTSPLALRDMERVYEAVKIIRIETSDKHRRENTLAIGAALKRYADFHEGDIAHAANWCETLVKGHYLDDQRKLLWLAGRRRWSWAINPRCGPDSPGETVLLFETRPGWNLRSGPELIQPFRPGSKGGYVFCKNGELKFVTADAVAQLVWE